MAVYPIAAVRGKAVGGAASYISAWLLRDDFTTPESAPIADPRTAEPGPGTWAVTDTSGDKITLSGGNLVLVGKFVVNDPAVFFGPITRSAGVAFFWQVVSQTNDSGERGFFASASISPGTRYSSGYSGSMKIWGATLSAIYMGTSIRFILRSSGCFLVTGTKLHWVDINGSSNMYAGFSPDSGTHTIDFGKVAQLVAPWNDDYGIATNRVASPSTGETTTMEADAIIEFTWTPAAGQTLDLMIRRDSDTDTWSVVCAESTAANANTIKLIERNAGDTERSSAAQTFSAGSAYRIVVIIYGTTIKTYVSNTAKNSYSSASHNQTSTGVKVSGFTTGSNLVVWPRTLSGDAAAALDEVANA